MSVIDVSWCNPSSDGNLPQSAASSKARGDTKSDPMAVAPDVGVAARRISVPFRNRVVFQDMSAAAAIEVSRPGSASPRFQTIN
jgi:hypothetical protein